MIYGCENRGPKGFRTPALQLTSLKNEELKHEKVIQEVKECSITTAQKGQAKILHKQGDTHLQKLH